jgi:RNA methyltransferase, TrmH family
MNLLSSLQDAHVKKLRLLKNQEGPFASTHFLIEGQHLVDHALAAGVLESIYMVDRIGRFPDSVKIFQCSPHVLESISTQKTPQGIIGLCRKKQSILPLTNTIAYFDQINDPGNVGTMLRTALGLGISTVIVSPQTASRYNPKVIASSQGAMFGLTILEDDDQCSQLKFHQQLGYHTVVTNLSAEAIPLPHYRFKEKNLLVVGNESHGVRPALTALAHGQVTIPMKKIDSLNVAIAFAIIAYRCLQYQPSS